MTKDNKEDDGWKDYYNLRFPPIGDYKLKDLSWDKEYMMKHDITAFGDYYERLKNFTNNVEKNKRVNDDYLQIKVKALEVEVKKVTDERDKLEKEVVQLVTDVQKLKETNRKLKLEAEQKTKKTGLKFLFTYELQTEINREVVVEVRAVPFAKAIGKMGKAPHAAWRSIVDNENEGQL